MSALTTLAVLIVTPPFLSTLIANSGPASDAAFSNEPAFLLVTHPETT